MLAKRKAKSATTGQIKDTMWASNNNLESATIKGCNRHPPFYYPDLPPLIEVLF
ncbi:MAG TPA: hypothetical protein V6D13_17670 [Halomicronema sp.]